jgi:hypothetical protein
MRAFLVVAAFAVVACNAIQNADHHVNKMTDHGTSRGHGTDDDGGASPNAADAGTDSGITSM